MSEQLKSCPFCGSTELLMLWAGGEPQTYTCKCGVMCPAKVWNTRTPDIKIAVEALKLIAMQPKPNKNEAILLFDLVKIVADEALKKLGVE